MIQRRKISGNDGKGAFSTVAVVLAAHIFTGCACGDTTRDTPGTGTGRPNGSGGTVQTGGTTSTGGKGGHSPVVPVVFIGGNAELHAIIITHCFQHFLQAAVLRDPSADKNLFFLCEEQDPLSRSRSLFPRHIEMPLSDAAAAMLQRKISRM